jgi:hypothetical protein
MSFRALTILIPFCYCTGSAGGLLIKLGNQGKFFHALALLETGVIVEARITAVYSFDS